MKYLNILKLLLANKGDFIVKFKLLSSLEKCLLDGNIDNLPEYTSGSCLKNECFQFQVAITSADDLEKAVGCSMGRIVVESPIKEHLTIKRVEPIAVKHAAYANRKDDNYIGTEPGLYPDVLLPLIGGNKYSRNPFLQSIWIEYDPIDLGMANAGTHPITIKFYNNVKASAYDDYQEKCFGSVTFNLEIIDAELPKQDLIYTQWFYTDCLQSYYDTSAFDERHWQIIENFMKTAKKRGINMILTPIFTVITDTGLDTERPTNQLVDVYLDNGKYSFNFDKLGRWVDLCDKVGIEYFEMSHLFSQWGAQYSPKIMATVDGVYKRLFAPIITSATGEEYTAFLNAFIPELLAFLKSKNNADKRCYFHISDEPRISVIENYAAARKAVNDLLKGYPIIDALSNYEYFDRGYVDVPVPTTEFIDKFIEKDKKDIWGYYCCWEAVEVSNHFIAQPSARNRIIGEQIYKYNLVGFLHWGYNFYYTAYSYDLVNPYLTADSNCFGPAGDSHVVYPAQDGTAVESIRLLVFFDALQDLRAFKLCEQLYSKEFVMNIIEDGIEEITFKKYPKEADYILNIRERINKAIKDKIQGRLQ